MSLNEWFDKGMSLQQYLDSMTVNKEGLLHIFENCQLSADDRAFFEQLQAKYLRVIVLTADWCGDAMLCLPIMMRIAEVASIKMSLLIRDDNLELMDQYLTNGKSRSIPIFIFIDSEGNEQAVWGPRAPEVQQLVEDLQRSLPPKEDPQFGDAQKQMFREFKEKLIADSSMWDAVIRSMRERLAKTL